MLRSRTLMSCILLISLACCVANAETKYKSAREAYGVGAAFHNSRNYESSREPFEAALELAENDAYRVKVYEALLASYRLLPKSDKMVEACEFIIDNAEHDAKKSLTRRSLLGFMYQRGKIDDLAKRYEKRLKKDEDDRAALYVLSELYATAKRDPEKAIAYANRLNKVDGKQESPIDVLQSGNLARQYSRAKKFKEAAELYEKIAPHDEKLAAWNWKEAASCWLKDGNEAKALAAAKKSHTSSPEARNDQLAHFWHRNLGDVLLATGEAKLAIDHYEKAIKFTTNDGYVEGTQESLAKAREQASE